MKRHQRRLVIAGVLAFSSAAVAEQQARLLQVAEYEACLEELLPVAPLLEAPSWLADPAAFQVALRVQARDMAPFRVVVTAASQGEFKAEIGRLQIANSLERELVARKRRLPTKSFAELCSDVEVEARSVSTEQEPRLREALRALDHLQARIAFDSAPYVEPNHYELWISRTFARSHYRWDGLDTAAPGRMGAHPLSAWVEEFCRILELRLEGKPS